MTKNLGFWISKEAYVYWPNDQKPNANDNLFISGLYELSFWSFFIVFLEHFDRVAL